MEEIINNVQRNREFLRGDFWERYQKFDEQKLKDSIDNYDVNYTTSDTRIRKLTDDKIERVIDSALQEVSSIIQLPTIDDNRKVNSNSKYKSINKTIHEELPMISSFESPKNSTEVDSNTIKMLDFVTTMYDDGQIVFNKSLSTPSITKSEIVYYADKSVCHKSAISRIENNHESQLPNTIKPAITEAEKLMHDQTTIINSTENLITYKSNETSNSYKPKNQAHSKLIESKNEINSTKLCKREKLEMIRLLNKNVSVIFLKNYLFLFVDSIKEINTYIYFLLSRKCT